LVALLCAPPPAGAVSELISALGWSEAPFVPLSEEEAHHALERDLLLKVGKYLRASDYPGEARRWRWTGTVLVEVLVAADGMVKQVALSRTSGFRVLDMQALEVVRRVSRLFVPVGLRQRDRTVTVPVSFYLQKS
jgi:protein TonB